MLVPFEKIKEIQALLKEVEASYLKGELSGGIDEEDLLSMIYLVLDK